MTDATKDTRQATAAPDQATAADTVTGAAETTSGGAATMTAGSDDTVQASATSDWPDDWRERMVGDVNTAEGKKALGILKRYASPKSWTESGLALRQKLSTGELKGTLPKDATPEQVNEWRKNNGIPEKPDGYDLNLGDGLVIGEQDKPLVNKFLESMHGANASPDTVKSALKAYYGIVAEQHAEQEAADSDRWKTTEDSLRAEWGGEYRANQNLIKGLVATAPETVREQIANARLPDGSRIGDNAETVRWLAQLAKEINPTATIVPGSGSHAIDTIQTEMAAIEKKMGSTAYTEKDRARYTELAAIEEKHKQRAA